MAKPRRAIVLTPAIEWLLREGPAMPAPGVLLGGLCDRLMHENLPLASALLSVAHLDPMVSRTRLRWQRDSRQVVEEVLLHGMTPELATDGGDCVRFEFAQTGHEIQWRSASTAFSASQREFLHAVGLAMAAPLQAVIWRGVTRGLLQAYLGRRSADKVLSGSVRRGSGELIEAVIWISDLRNFTGLSQLLNHQQIIAALNDCCARLVGAIQPFGGEVLKFIGDGLLAIFPITAGRERAACDAAVAAIKAARQGMANLDAERVGAGLGPLPFGIGLHRGAVVYGNIGSPDRLDFTAVGAAVNVASRIESLCRPLACPVLISGAVAGCCGTSLAPLGNYPVQGCADPVALFTLAELAPHTSA